MTYERRSPVTQAQPLIRKLKEIPSSTRIMCMGDSGSGKTRTLGSFIQLAESIGGAALLVTADREGEDTLVAMDLDPDTLYLDNWANVLQYQMAIREWKQQHKDQVTFLLMDDVGFVQGRAKDYVMSKPRGRAEARLSVKDQEMQALKQTVQGDRPPRS